MIAAGGDWTIIRPPAIYGPGDREMLELFRAAQRRIVPMPRGTRLSIIAVEDLCRLMLACLASELSSARIYEPDDGRTNGWSAAELARMIGDAVGRRVLTLSLPRAALTAVSMVEGALRGPRAKLTRDRVAYFCHPDWTASAHARPSEDVWKPEIDTRAGLAATARWYRAKGWLS